MYSFKRTKNCNILMQSCAFNIRNYGDPWKNGKVFYSFPYSNSLSKYFGFQYLNKRFYGSRSLEGFQICHKKTLNLPETKFPMKADALKREPGLLKKGIYEWQKQTRSKKNTWVLHDGPPYANGSPHMGHALNKILKDIINRYKILKGYYVNYIPGWDCHGLPIELKVLEKLKENSHDLSIIDIRSFAREYALEQVKIQRSHFEKWGVLGDWDNSYMTMDFEYEAYQIGVFLKMVQQGLIYRDYKPVYWSPSSKTALAEAELEYNENHVSKSLYVLFKVKKLSIGSPLNSFPYLEDLYMLVWTTTPWTLPANMAICISPSVKYTIIKDSNHLNSENKESTIKESNENKCLNNNENSNSDSGEIYYIVSQDTISSIEKLTQKNITVLSEYSFEGSALLNAFYEHPFISDHESVVIAADYVSNETGTGLVHMAPGHGQEDFNICKLNGIPIYSPVDEYGCFTSDVGDDLKGQQVLSDGTEKCIELLKQKKLIYHLHNFKHKYPYDWRTKKPVIIRATQQWFANVHDIQKESIEALESVSMKSGKNVLTQMLLKRPDWCISRQRSWGVPIPVFYDADNDEPLMTDQSIAHIQSLVRQHGTDCWWKFPIEELLAPEYRNNGKTYYIGVDTMDVWFDSGCSWAGVLLARNISLPADLYLEGSDQYRGWLQSSLLTSVTATCKAPYKSIITHGFVLDENGQKMSKSLGNVVNPDDVIIGNPKSEKKNQYGVDVLRFWLASLDYTNDIYFSEESIENSSLNLRKIRNTARFLLGNLHEVDINVKNQLLRILPEQLNSVDRYFMHILYNFLHRITQYYEKYCFSSVLRELNKFVASDLSAFYLNILKDRLYATDCRKNTYKSAQFVLIYILDVLAKVIAPIACHTAEDIYNHFPWIETELNLIAESSSNPRINQSDSKIVQMSPKVSEGKEIENQFKNISSSENFSNESINGQDKSLEKQQNPSDLLSSFPISHTADNKSFQDKQESSVEKPSSIFTETWPQIPDFFYNPQLEEDWNPVMDIRAQLYRLIEKLRANNKYGINLSSEIDVFIFVKPTHPVWKLTLDELAEVFIVARVALMDLEESNPDLRSLMSDDNADAIIHDSCVIGKGYIIQVKKSNNKKCKRCWRYVCFEPDSLCTRCEQVLSGL